MEEVNYNNIKEIITEYLKTNPVLENKSIMGLDNLESNSETTNSLTKYLCEDIEIVNSISNFDGSLTKTIAIISEEKGKLLEVSENTKLGTNVSIKEVIFKYYDNNKLSFLLEDKKITSSTNGNIINNKIRITERNSNSTYNTNHYDIYADNGVAVMINTDDYTCIDDTDLLNRLLVLNNRIASLNDKFISEVKHYLGFETKVKEYKIKRKITKE